jgi:shikimate kinase
MRLPRLLTCTAAAVSATLVAGFLTEPAPAHAADGHGSLAAGLSGAGSTVIDERTGLAAIRARLAE